jgi:hypothetical protein
MWPQDVGVISLPERQALGRDGPNSRQLDNALGGFIVVKWNFIAAAKVFTLFCVAI